MRFCRGLLSTGCCFARTKCFSTAPRYANRIAPLPSSSHLPESHQDMTALLDALRASDAVSERLLTPARTLDFIDWLFDRSAPSSGDDDAKVNKAKVSGTTIMKLLREFERTTSAEVEGANEEEGAGAGDADAAQKATKKKRKNPRLSTAVRNAVWNEWVGVELGVGPCHCCGRPISQQDYECGHVVAASRGGSNAPSNLRPLCRACNRSMRDENMYEFKQRVGFAEGGDPMDVS